MILIERADAWLTLSYKSYLKQHLVALIAAASDRVCPEKTVSLDRTNPMLIRPSASLPAQDQLGLLQPF